MAWLKVFNKYSSEKSGERRHGFTVILMLHPLSPPVSVLEWGLPEPY